MIEKPNSVNRCKFILASGRECRELEGWHTRHTHAFVESSPFEPVAEPAEPSASPQWMRQESCSECDGDGCNLCNAEPELIGAAPQPVAACLGLDACTQKEACLKVNRCLKNLPQPVAGEGPQEEEMSDVGRLELRNGAVFKCIHEDKTGLRWVRVLDAEQLSAVIEGMPKLEEIARQIESIHAPTYKTPEERERVVAAYVKILRPFITPACPCEHETLIQQQTEKRMEVLLDDNCIETIKRLTPEGGEEIFFGGVMGGIRLKWNVATPASTGEGRGINTHELAHEILSHRIIILESENGVKPCGEYNGEPIYNMAETIGAETIAINQLQDVIDAWIKLQPVSTGRAQSFKEGCKEWLKDAPIYAQAQVAHESEVSAGGENGWISVEDRLPEPGLKVEGIIAKAAYRSFAYRTEPMLDDGTIWTWRHAYAAEGTQAPWFTHWRELPPAPTSVPQAEPPKKESK